MTIYSSRTGDVPFALIDRAYKVIPQTQFHTHLPRDKEPHILKLVNSDGSSAAEKFTRKLCGMSLVDLERLASHLDLIFNEGFDFDVKEDIICSLTSVHPSVWKEISKQADYIVGNNLKGHDIGWATSILCQLCHISRSEFVKIVHSMFEWEDDSRIRVRFLAAMANFSVSELRSYKTDAEKQRQLRECVQNDIIKPWDMAKLIEV